MHPQNHLDGGRDPKADASRNWRREGICIALALNGGLKLGVSKLGLKSNLGWGVGVELLQNIYNIFS